MHQSNLKRSDSIANFYSRYKTAVHYFANKDYRKALSIVDADTENGVAHLMLSEISFGKLRLIDALTSNNEHNALVD